MRENYLFNFPSGLALSLFQYANHKQSSTAHSWGLFQNTHPKQKYTLLVYGILHFKWTNLEKIPGFERVKQISIGFFLYGIPKAFKQLLKCCSDRHHSSLNLEMRCRLKMIKK